VTQLILITLLHFPCDIVDEQTARVSVEVLAAVTYCMWQKKRESCSWGFELNGSHLNQTAQFFILLLASKPPQRNDVDMCSACLPFWRTCQKKKGSRQARSTWKLVSVFKWLFQFCIQMLWENLRWSILHWWEWLNTFPSTSFIVCENRYFKASN